MLKLLILFLVIIKITFANVCPTGGPEIWIQVTDNQYATYHIIATKADNTPIYDRNYNFTTEFNTAEDYFDVVPNVQSDCEGFDWIWDENAITDPTNDDLGYGYYFIRVIRNTGPESQENIIQFYLDLRMEGESVISSPDVFIKIQRTVHGSYIIQNSFLTLENGLEWRTMNNDDIINIWENHYGQDKDFGPFMKPIELTNDFGGSPNFQNKIKLISAPYGFPENQYSEGHEFTPGDDVYFWHSVNYTFNVESNIVHINGIDYKARHWNTNNNVGLTKEILIDQSPSFTSIIVFYMPILPITVANYLEGVNGGNYQVEWNKNIGTFETINSGTSYNAFVYNQQNQDRYNIIAPITFLNLFNTNWIFQKWNDGSTNNIKSNLQITAPTIYTAYYKGIQRSDEQNAYVSNSQRKFVRTDDGILHNVYCSQCRVWYETSSDNGVTWLLANNGQPLDSGEGKLPSIDYSIYYGGQETYYQVFIVFQEKYGSTSKIKVKCFQSIGGGGPYSLAYEAEVGSVQGSYYSTYTTPVIGVHSNYFTVVWKGTGNLYARAGHINVPDDFVWDSGLPNALTGTYSTSVNPTISFSKTFYAHQKLAWEDQADGWKVIKYATLSGSQISGSITTPSNGSGFSDNYSPSIVQFMNASRLCWVGSRWVSDPINEEDGFPQTKVLFKAPESTPSRFWQFGNFVSGPSINRKTGDDTYYAFAWYESLGQSKFADNTLSTIRTITGVNGQNLQTSNGPNKENMFCMSFNHNVALPYIFQMSNNLGSFYNMEKITYFAFNSGREGIVSVDSAEFYFAIGDISVDNQQINFKEIEDSIQISTLSDLNDYLVSEPFEVSDNSSFIYSVQYGINDSASAANAMIENRYISFKVKLIDSNTGEILGEFDNVTYNSENVFQHNNISYQVNTQGLGNRTVRLSLSVDNNFNSDYSLSKIYSDESVLGKINFKEINIIGNGVISTYDLFQNYPNPFNPSTTIKYQIPKSGNVTLKVYDILGNEVTKLVDEYMETGRYEIGFDASILASGVYIYRLTVNDFVNVKKMVLLR